MAKEVPKYELIIASKPSLRFNSLVISRNRNFSFYLFVSSSLIIISYVIYLCNYYDIRSLRHSSFDSYTKYGPIVKFRSRTLVNPKLWNTERDDNSDDYPNEVISKSNKFDITSDDVMVFLQIQNTGGNVFLNHIINDLIIDSPCNCRSNHRKRCQCLRPNRANSQWLFSRLTVGTKCGIHPDFNELIHCTDRVLDELEGDSVKRRYFYITLLRDPITRFISEYNHFKSQELNGKASRHWCGGQEVIEIPDCQFSTEVSMDEFIECENNLAINRQTRMLSDLALVGCYNRSYMRAEERDLVMLTSAQNNLHKMAFLGLNEFPRISQYLFEETFDLVFLDADTHAFHRNKRSLMDQFSAKTIDKIKRTNSLDLKLYEFAKQLMFERFERLKHKNPKLKDLSVVSVAKDNIGIIDWGDSEDKQSVL